MPTATMTSKGQITVPKEVRVELGLETGSRVMFVKVGEGQYRLLARTGEVTGLAGFLQRPGREAVSLEQMDDAVAESAAAAAARPVSEPDVGQER